VCVAGTFALPDGREALATASLAGIPLAFVLYLVVGWFSGPLLEEPGWRGFALPRLQSVWGPLAGSLVLGLLWGAWHIPQFLVPVWAAQTGGSDPATIGRFLVFVLALAVPMTWVFNHARGSLFLAMLSHSSINASLAMLPLAPTQQLDVGLITFGGVALLLIVATKGRLGLPPLLPAPDDRSAARPDESA